MTCLNIGENIKKGGGGMDKGMLQKNRAYLMGEWEVTDFTYFGVFEGGGLTKKCRPTI